MIVMNISLTILVVAITAVIILSIITANSESIYHMWNWGAAEKLGVFTVVICVISTGIIMYLLFLGNDDPNAAYTKDGYYTYDNGILRTNGTAAFQIATVCSIFTVIIYVFLWLGLIELFKKLIIFIKPWRNKNEEKALQGVKKLTDQAKLAKIAREEQRTKVQEAVIEMITDQEILLNFIFESNFNYGLSNLKIYCLKYKITDQRALANAVIKQKSNFPNYMADAVIDKLTDREALTEVAKFNIHDNIREKATIKLGDKNIN